MRSDREGIIVRELAVAGRFVLHRAQALQYGVGHTEGGALDGAVLLLPQLRVIPAEAQIECEFARDLPRILRVQPVSMAAYPGIRDSGGAHCVRQAKQKASITVTAA